MIFNPSYIGRTAASFPSRGATVKVDCRKRQGRIVFAGGVRGNTRTRNADQLDVVAFWVRLPVTVVATLKSEL
jgi:hypothetical protein